MEKGLLSTEGDTSDDASQSSSSLTHSGQHAKRAASRKATGEIRFRQGGNLRFPLNERITSRASKIIDEMNKGADANSTLDKYDEYVHWTSPVSNGPRVPQTGKRDSLTLPPEDAELSPRDQDLSVERKLVVMYTDCEVDDVMAVAQLWQWRSQLGDMEDAPLIIFAADFKEKETGKIFEKKCLMASLIGVNEMYALASQDDKADEKSPWDSKIHPRAPDLVNNRDAIMNLIAERIKEFEGRGTQVDFYIMAPGHGNIGGIVNKLKSKSWPPWPEFKTRLVLYTGAFNMRGMTDSDIEGIKELMKFSEEPLVDISRFPFFGGDKAHNATRGLGEFCLPTLAKEIIAHNHLLAAAMKTFHDEFNFGLIAPDNNRLFQRDKDDKVVLTENDAALFAKITDAYKEAKDKCGQSSTDSPEFRAAVKEYAWSLHMDLGHRVANHKKSTVAAIAHDGCEAPLCDQLVFAYEYLAKEKPAWLAEDGKPAAGKWEVDRQRGFTNIIPNSPGGIRAIQPTLANFTSLTRLKELRLVTQAYFLRHIDSLSKFKPTQVADLKEVPRFLVMPNEERGGRPGPPDSSTGVWGATGSSTSSALPATGIFSVFQDIGPLLRDLLRDEEENTEDGTESVTGEENDAWMRVVEGQDPPKDADHDRDSDQGEAVDDLDSSTVSVIPPEACGFKFYDRRVRELANKEALRLERVTTSSCAGPVLALAFALRILQVMAGTGLGLLAYFTCTCEEEHSSPTYDARIWAPYAIFMAAHLAAEVIIFRHLSIPYLQKVGKWTMMKMELLGHERSFHSWICVHIALSALHLFGLGTANVFLGMVAAEQVRKVCDDNNAKTAAIENRLIHHWDVTIRQSYLVQASIQFWHLPAFVFLVQLVYLLFDIARLLPRWNQTTTKGIHYRYNVQYPQPLEREVIEYIPPRQGGVSVTGKERPTGTRFIYFSWTKELHTTGAVLDRLCHGSGMSMIVSMDNFIDTVGKETIESLKNIDKGKLQSVEGALKGTRKCLQDVCSVLNNKILRVLFTGLLWSGLHLQLQVTYFNLHCSAEQLDRCPQATPLWLGILIAMLSSVLVLLQIPGSLMNFSMIQTVVQLHEREVMPAADAFLETNSQKDNAAMQTLQNHVQDVADLRGKVLMRLSLQFVVTVLHLLNFIWAVMKMYMDQNVCDDHMWNIAWPLERGCANLTDTHRRLFFA